MRLRIVRFQLDNGNFETLATSLPRSFTVDDLKEIYHRRWGIETSFRDLKYSAGLVNLHGKRDDFVEQEIYAALTAFNFTSRIVVISLIAAANVFNTISTNIKLRRRELAMLRSVGMSDRDFNKMMRFECAFYGVRALAAGIPLSLLASMLIVKAMSADDTRFLIPWGSMGISVLSVFLVIFVTMM